MLYFLATIFIIIFRVNCELEIVHYYSNLCSSIVLNVKVFYEIAIYIRTSNSGTYIILLNCAPLCERIVSCLPFDALTLLPQVVEIFKLGAKFNVKITILICVFRNILTG